MAESAERGVLPAARQVRRAIEQCRTWGGTGGTSAFTEFVSAARTVPGVGDGLLADLDDGARAAGEAYAELATFLRDRIRPRAWRSARFWRVSESAMTARATRYVAVAGADGREDAGALVQRRWKTVRRFVATGDTNTASPHQSRRIDRKMSTEGGPKRAGSGPVPVSDLRLGRPQQPDAPPTHLTGRHDWLRGDGLAVGGR